MRCNHMFDETGHCFECDLPNQERLAQMNRERVQRHRDNKRKTLVKVEVWIKPENKVKLVKFLEEDEM